MYFRTDQPAKRAQILQANIYLSYRKIGPTLELLRYLTALLFHFNDRYVAVTAA